MLLVSQWHISIHEWMDVLEHRVETGGPEQRMRCAAIQPVDQGSQIVADLQRVRGLDSGGGDPRQIAIRTERAAGERLEIQCGHLV